LSLISLLSLFQQLYYEYYVVNKVDELQIVLKAFYFTWALTEIVGTIFS